MSFAEYEKAQKLGLKALKNAVAKGENEYLPVLDEILKDVDIQSEISLGLVQIPLDRVVGTSNFGRTTAFANNFMPLLDFKTEFGSKWSHLCDAHLEEGIREPIKVYEYLNKFYVIEGNKRVSVLKFYGAVSYMAYVTRKIPKLTDDPEIKLYYEFMDFYKVTQINYLNFTQEGCYKRLLELTCDDPTVPWTGDQQKDFGSANHNFCKAFKERKGDRFINESDALLIFIDIYGYDNIKDLTSTQMKEKIDLLWDEFMIESKGREIQLRMEPSKKGRKKLMEYFSASKKLLVAFVFDKDPQESEWLYGHELGRLYLDEHFSNKIKTIKVHNITSDEDAITAMEDLILMGVKVIFTTSSRQVAASLKCAVNHPEVIILNCSLNTSHKLIRTYYARLYEVKFLAGIIAGSLSRDGRIGYLADYPIVGAPANINAFALGANMVNPEAKVYLEWTTVKGVSREMALRTFKDKGIHYVSDQVMIKPNAAGRQFGLYYIDEDETVNIAMPVYQWGVFYERLLESVLEGTFKQEASNGDKAINYWWGLSAGVVDLIYSEKVPRGTKKLVHTIKELIIKSDFFPFQDEIYSQDGELKNEKNQVMLPEDIMKMNWLADNVIGEIPEVSELKEEAKPIVELKGVTEEAKDTKGVADEDIVTGR